MAGRLAGGEKQRRRLPPVPAARRRPAGRKLKTERTVFSGRSFYFSHPKTAFPANNLVRNAVFDCFMEFPYSVYPVGMESSFLINTFIRVGTETYRERRRTSTYNTRLNRKETGFSNRYKKSVNIPSTHLFMHLQDTRTMKIKLTLLSVLFLSVIHKLIHLFLIILRNIFLPQ